MGGRGRWRFFSPSLPNPSLPALHPPNRGERGSKRVAFSLFSPEGRVEGWEKRAGVMRDNGPGTQKLTKSDY
jgi:hypothetical protein